MPKIRIKHTAVFLLSVGLFLFVAGHRFGDSGHAITLISQQGGRAQHPIELDKASGRGAVIITSTVLPPYSGDARIVLEGGGDLTYRLYFSEPIINLGLTARPSFSENTLYGLKPGDRISLWLLLEDLDKTPTKTCRLTFNDTRTNSPVLTLPIQLYQAAGDEDEAKATGH